MNRVRPIGLAVMFVTAVAIIFWFACSKKNPIDPTAPISGEIPLLIDVDASPSQIVVGGGQSTIKAKLVNQNGMGLAGRTVQFSTDLGTMTEQAVTNDTGGVWSVLTSGQNAGTAKITLQYGKQTAASASVRIISSAQGHLRITASQNEIFANGMDTTSVVVTLLSDSLKPVTGREVRISNSAGTLSPPGLTDQYGQIPLVLTSSARAADTSAVVRAVYQNDSVGVVILFKGVTFSASANPVDILADGKSTSTIQALVKQTSTNIPLADQKIEFGTDAGTVAGQAMTDESGLARSTLMGSTTPDTAHVLVKYGTGFYRTVNVAFHARTESQFTIAEMTASPQSILANGADPTTISLKVVDAEQKPVQGLDVRLETTAGKLYASTIATDAEGRASVALTADTSSVSDLTAVVTASVGLASRQVSVTMIAVQFDVSVSADTMMADGQSTCTVTALLKKRATQVAVANAAVSFGTDRGLIAGEASTGAEGTAKVALRSSLEVNMVNALVSARYGAFLPRTRTVVFKPLSAKRYQLIDLSALPNVMLANGSDKSKISVMVVDESQNPVKGQRVSFTANAGRFVSQESVSGDDGMASVELIADTSSVSDMVCGATASLGLESRSVNLNFLAVQLTLSTSADTILANGESISLMTAVLKRRTTQVAVPGAKILFGTDRGVIPAEGTTDASGVASVQLKSTSETNLSTAHVTAQYGGFVPVGRNVVFRPPTAKQYAITNIQAASSALLANGIEQTSVTVTVADEDQAALVGRRVSFTASAGTITSESVIGADGIAAATLTCDTSSTADILCTVTATFGLSSRQTTVKFTAVGLEITAIPAAIIADGTSKSKIQVILKETVNKTAVSGATVAFATDLGTIPAQSVAGSSGVAEVNLTSVTTVGTAHVTARYGKLTSSAASVVFQASVPTYLEVTATPPVIPADGRTASTIQAVVTDASRNPVPDGIPVSFNILSGSGSSIINQRFTSGGMAESGLTSTVPGTKRVRVSVGGLADTVDVVCAVGSVAQILVASGLDQLPADGITNTTITAQAMDGQGNPVSGITMNFTASIGDITRNAITNVQGTATAKFSSGTVGTATITATVGAVTGTKIIRLMPGGVNSIVLRFSPKAIGVSETGQEKTATVEAEVKDSKGNPVADGTLVRFDILDGPGGGEKLNSYGSMPTVNGIARVSLTSGIRSGAVRIQAEVLDINGNPIKAIAEEILIHAGEPYMENVNDFSTRHITIAAGRLNVWSTLDTTLISVMVGDKFNNPAQKGTAVYFTTSGGVINTHTAYTDEYGKATVLLTGGNPQPTVDRFYGKPPYNNLGIEDPNYPKKVSTAHIPGYINYPLNGDSLWLPNFDVNLDNLPFGATLSMYPGLYEDGAVPGSWENNGIARIVAWTPGQDATGDSVKVWDWLPVVMSGPVGYDDNSPSTMMGRTLNPGQYTTMRFRLWDHNGNPIESNSTIKAELVPQDAQAALSWNEINTGSGQGVSWYFITISNNISTEKPKPGPAAIKISWQGAHQYGSVTTSSVWISAGTP